MIPNIPTLPLYIALCGNPKAGKSLVQEILQQIYAITPVDDGAPLREFAVTNLGLNWEQVTRQAGKLEFVEILGRTWQVREILGELGNALEAKFGKDILPFIALKRCERLEGPFSFGSVRRDQGKVYKAKGGIVIEIENPDALPSTYEFDQFDRSIVDYTIHNDALFHGANPTEARIDLERKVLAIIAQHAAVAA